MSKKLEEKQARRREQERKQAEHRKAAFRRNLITIVLAVAVAVAVVGAIWAERRNEEGPGSRVGVPAAQAGCGPVEEFEAQEAAHIEPGTPHPEYNSDPPSSGPHYASPVDPGFYSDPLEPEQVVHNLEHGQIVIWYESDLPEEEKQLIEEIVSDDLLATVALPYNVPGDDSYALTAWLAGAQGNEEDHGTGILQTCDRVSQAAVDEFRRDYQGKSPEPLTRPFTG